jgi:transposase-like protein
LTKVAAVDADCTTAGKEQHYICDGCGKIFSDSKGTKEITDKDSLIIPAAGHKDSKWKSDADVHWKECTVKGCDAITEEKAAHEFNKTGKCTVCGYKSSDKAY